MGKTTLQDIRARIDHINSANLGNCETKIQLHRGSGRFAIDLVNKNQSKGTGAQRLFSADTKPLLMGKISAFQKGLNHKTDFCKKPL